MTEHPGALAQYAGPVILLRGDIPTHYLLVAAPLILVVAARGVAVLSEIAFAALASRWPAAAISLRHGRRAVLWEEDGRTVGIRALPDLKAK